MQVQWQHQICTSKLPHGMAVPLPEKALRTLQDAFPIHKALPSSHAYYRASSRVPTPSRHPHMEIVSSLVAHAARPLCLAWLAPLVHEDCVEGHVLDRRWRLVRLETHGTRSFEAG